VSSLHGERVTSYRPCNVQMRIGHIPNMMIWPNYEAQMRLSAG